VVKQWSNALRLTTCSACVALLLLGAACGGSSSKSAIAVRLAEWKITASTITLDHGSQTLRITNGGKIPHELLVFRPDAGTDPHALPVSSDGDINEDGPGAKKISDGDNINPGKSQTRTVDFATPGTYVLVCNIAGHYKQGMSQIVTVK